MFFANFGCLPLNSVGSEWMDVVQLLKCFELFLTHCSVVARLLWVAAKVLSVAFTALLCVYCVSMIFRPLDMLGSLIQCMSMGFPFIAHQVRILNCIT